MATKQLPKFPLDVDYKHVTRGVHMVRLSFNCGTKSKLRQIMRSISFIILLLIITLLIGSTVVAISCQRTLFSPRGASLDTRVLMAISLAKLEIQATSLRSECWNAII
jgi:hypothetical protein